jgi:outer membrane protein TolC
MKRKYLRIIYILIGIFLMTQLSVYAEEQPIAEFDFYQIEGLILERNPNVQINDNNIEKLSLEDNVVTDTVSESDLENSIEGVDNQIIALQAKKAAIQAPGADDLVLTSYYNFIMSYYDEKIAEQNKNRQSLVSQLNSIDDEDEEEAEEAEDEAYEQTVQQYESANYQRVKSAEALYINYNSSILQQEIAEKNLELLTKELEIAKQKLEYGIIAQDDVTDLEDEVEKSNDSITSLKEQRDSIVKDMNLMLGQDYSVSLTFGTVPVLTEEAASSVSYTEDVGKVLNKNYSIRKALKDLDDQSDELDDMEDNNDDDTNEYDMLELEHENAQLSLEQDKANLELSFYNMCKDIQDKLKSLQTEKKELEDMKTTYEQLEVKYNAGMISSFELMKGKSNYQIQELNVKSAEYSLFHS